MKFGWLESILAVTFIVTDLKEQKLTNDIQKSVSNDIKQKPPTSFPNKGQS